MIRKITCIDCPKGCQLTLEVEGNRLLKVSGNECEKGESYARQEVENPTRVLTSVVLAEGLSLKMVPVRTDRPIPKEKILPVAEEIKKIVLKRPVKVGEIIAANILGSGANIVSTRDVT